MLDGLTPRRNKRSDIVLSFLLACASWNSEGHHLDIVDGFLKLGYDFSNSPLHNLNHGQCLAWVTKE
jgi:hypothetical protein